MDTRARIYVAGGETLLGAAIRRQLKQQGYVNLVGAPGEEPDLADAVQVDAFFGRTRPEYVFVAAGRSGGIGANQRYPAELIRNNLLVACHVVHSAYRHGTRKLLYVASSCTYPKHCAQPMSVEALLTGPLEPTSEAYAVAKIAGIKLCQAYRQQYGANFISAIPADAFGPGDDIDPEDSHVIAGLLRRMHDAKLLGSQSVEIWGTGVPRREFIFADDLADACIFVMREYEGPQPINLGGGVELAIRELAELIKDVVGYEGQLRFDSSKPDGIPLKILDSSELRRIGWWPRTPFRTALVATYDWLQESLEVRAASRTAGLAATAASRNGRSQSEGAL